ncbi:MAG: ComF family protein [Desulfovibrio sp.]|nr:ComF family protein [Desulfovibrio sp.]
MATAAAAVRRTAAGEKRCFACSGVFYPEDAGCGKYFCPDCAQALQGREMGFCPSCGELYSWALLPPAPCPRCLHKPPPWQRFIFYGTHENLLRELLLALKFREQLHLAPVLAALLINRPAFANLNVDTVAPIPLHRRRLCQRGYNQALELARPVARALNVPLFPDLLLRVRETSPQTELGRSLRRQNIKGSFACGAAVTGRHILLVDDTMTTGATMTEAALTLLASGAASVNAAVISRAPALSLL